MPAESFSIHSSNKDFTRHKALVNLILGRASALENLPKQQHKCGLKWAGVSLTTYFLRISCFFCSSEVGRPIDFCRWSYIIFSTIPRVSPSRSDSCSGGKKTQSVGLEPSLETEKSEFQLKIKSFLTLYLWVLWTDFLGVYFWISGDNSAPPLHFIDLELKKAMRLGISFIYCGELWFKISVLLFPSGLWQPCRRRWARSSPRPWSRCKAGPPGREGVPSGPPSACAAGCPPPHPCP